MARKDINHAVVYFVKSFRELMLIVNVMSVELAMVASVQVQKYKNKRHCRAICSGECGMVRLIKCL